MKNKKLFKLTAKQNLNFNILKVIEETTELNELLIKQLTKNEQNLDKLSEEIGDVEIRINILKNQLDLKKAVKNRKTFKKKMIYKKIKKNKL